MDQASTLSGLVARLVSDEKGDISAPAAQTPLPPLRFDVNEYRKYIEDENLTEAQAEELLGAIWLIMVSFVDLGFGLHPVQQAQDARRNINATANPLAKDSSRVLACKDTFNKASNTKPARRKRRAAGRKDS